LDCIVLSSTFVVSINNQKIYKMETTLENKRKRTFTHFNYKGKDIGTLGTFNDSKEFNSLTQAFGELANFDTIKLEDAEELKIARKLTGMKL